MRLFKRFTRPKAKLWVTIEKSELALGEELKGTVGVKAEEQIDLGGITVELNCWESIKEIVGYHRTTTRTPSTGWEDEEEEEEYYEKEEEWNHEILHSKILELCQKKYVDCGFNEEFPFRIKIPASERATYHSVDRNVEWLIKAKMDVKGRRNIATRTQEVLVSKPSSPQVKEVIREVVLISCRYCGGLMPQAATFCPNCGARRKAS